MSFFITTQERSPWQAVCCLRGRNPVSRFRDRTSQRRLDRAGSSRAKGRQGKPGRYTPCDSDGSHLAASSQRLLLASTASSRPFSVSPP